MTTSRQRRTTVILALILVASTSILSITILYMTSSQSNLNPFSVILMIGDGMGYEHVKLARWVEVGVDGTLNMEAELPRLWMVTHSADANITDSAAAATAFATGHKTNNGMLSVDTNGNPLKTITEIAQDLSKSTGVISTCYVQHATPAAFMAHVSSRTDITAITQQIVDTAKIDIIMGGGSLYFGTTSLESMENQNYTIVRTRDSLAPVISSPLLGIFAGLHMPYERERDLNHTPSLAEMTRKSLEILIQDKDGFFLMVEGGKIDLAAHENNALDVALDTIAFDKAVSVALNFAQGNSDIIVIVTADHETGGLEVVDCDLDDNVPSLSYTEEQNRTLRMNRVNNVTVDWSSVDHTARHVPVFCYGEGLSNLQHNATIDNTDLFAIMHSWLTNGEVSIPTASVLQDTRDVIPNAPQFITSYLCIYKKKKSS